MFLRDFRGGFCGAGGVGLFLRGFRGGFCCAGGVGLFLRDFRGGFCCADGVGLFLRGFRGGFCCAGGVGLFLGDFRGGFCFGDPVEIRIRCQWRGIGIEQFGGLGMATAYGLVQPVTALVPIPGYALVTQQVQATQAILGLTVAPAGGAPVPLHRLPGCARQCIPAGFIQHGQLQLAGQVALLRGLPEPLFCLERVFFQALAIEIGQAEAELGQHLLLLRGLSVPHVGLFHVHRHALPEEMDDTQVVLGIPVALLRRAPMPLQALLHILLHSLTDLVHIAQMRLRYRVARLSQAGKDRKGGFVITAGYGIHGLLFVLCQGRQAQQQTAQKQTGQAGCRRPGGVGEPNLHIYLRFGRRTIPPGHDCTPG